MSDNAVADADASWLEATLIRDYGLVPASITRIPAGTQSDNFAVTPDGTGRRYFAKVRRPGYPAHTARIIELEQQAAASGDARLPAPRVFADRRGRLLVPVGDKAVSVHEFVAGDVSKQAWTPDVADEVGAILGRLHRWLAQCPKAAAAPLPVPDLWWTRPPTQALLGARRVIDAITALRREGLTDDTDLMRLEQVRVRIEDISRCGTGAWRRCWTR